MKVGDDVTLGDSRRCEVSQSGCGAADPGPHFFGPKTGVLGIQGGQGLSEDLLAWTQRPWRVGGGQAGRLGKHPPEDQHQVASVGGSLAQGRPLLLLLQPLRSGGGPGQQACFLPARPTPLGRLSAAGKRREVGAWICLCGAGNRQPPPRAPSAQLPEPTRDTPARAKRRSRNPSKQPRAREGPRPRLPSQSRGCRHLQAPGVPTAGPWFPCLARVAGICSQLAPLGLFPCPHPHPSLSRDIINQTA